MIIVKKFYLIYYCCKTITMICEHHFGNLDDSQQKWPNSSIYHYSTLQLLKHNRFRMMKWFHGILSNEGSMKKKQRSLWKAFGESNVYAAENSIRDEEKQQTYGKMLEAKEMMICSWKMEQMQNIWFNKCLNNCQTKYHKQMTR